MRRLVEFHEVQPDGRWLCNATMKRASCRTPLHRAKLGSYLPWDGQGLAACGHCLTLLRDANGQTMRYTREDFLRDLGECHRETLRQLEEVRSCVDSLPQYQPAVLVSE